MNTLAHEKPAATPALLDVGQVADLLNCSKRHVVRLADAGRLPRPMRLGGLVRWRRAEVVDWIAGGCEPVRQPGRAAL